LACVHDFLVSLEAGDAGNHSGVDFGFALSRWIGISDHHRHEGDLPEVKLANLNPNDRILPQINKIIGRDRFNHYRPAKQLIAGVKTIKMSAKTLERFESIFKVVNDRFSA